MFYPPITFLGQVSLVLADILRFYEVNLYAISFWTITLIKCI